MTNLIQELIQMPIPLPEEFVSKRANCFNAIQLYWGDCQEAEFTGPEEFVSFVCKYFKQSAVEEVSEAQDLIIVWSRSSAYLPLGEIVVHQLQKEKKGYPFGLVIEHAFIFLDSKTKMVFQKRDPSRMGPYEVVREQEALSPYQKLFGYEITRHQRKENTR